MQAVSKKRLWPKLLGVAIAVFVALVATVAWFARTETALRWTVELLAAQTDGRIRAEGASGSILGPLRFARIVYRQDDLTVAASEVRIEWSASSLWHGAVRIALVEVANVEIVAPDSAGATPLPETLALPWTVAIKSVRVKALTFRTGRSETAVRDIELRYAGGPERHRFADVDLRLPDVRLSGVLDVGAGRPYPVLGNLRAEGDGRLAGLNAEAWLGGTLDAVTFTLALEGHGLMLAGEGELAPFAARWLPRMTVHGDQLDIATIALRYPTTAIALQVDLHDTDRGFAGAVSIKNALPGPFTDNRLPLAALRAAFVFDGAAIDLDKLQADLGAAGSVAGGGRIAESGSRWTLAVERLNLRAFHRPLRATALRGKIRADVTPDGETIDAALSDRGVAFDVGARRRDERIDVRRLIVRFGSGEARGTGEWHMTGAQKFAGSATFRHIDPAEFGAYPSALLNGRADVRGVLAPEWRIEAAFKLNDSRLRGAPLAGQGKLAGSVKRVEDVNVALRIGENHVEARGDLGRPEDTLHVDFAGARLAQIDPRFAGRLAVQAQLSGALLRPSVAFEGTGSALRVLDGYAAERIEARGRISPDRDAPLRLVLDAHRLSWAQGALDSLAADISGTLALHEGEIRIGQDDIDLAARIAGSWGGEQRWRGTLVSLAGSGRYPIELAAPVPLEIAPSKVLLGAAQVVLLDGRFDMHRLRWEDGKIESAGEFTRLPAAPLLALAGLQTAPGSDLRLRGSWSIAATPRLNGFVRIAREAGDLRVDENAPRGLGLKQVDLEAQLVEDLVVAQAEAVSTMFGRGKASVEIVPPPGARPGRLSGDAALRGSASAQLESLRGLDALANLDFVVDAQVAIALAAHGTLRAPIITGTFDADGVRLDVPRYGIALNGTAHGVLDAQALSVEAALAAAAGGRLMITGSAPRRAGDGATKIEWRATELRLFNRRERRLTVSGGGSLALAPGKLVVRGEVRADEGYIEFERRGVARLSDDIIVVGRERPRARAGPLTLPLDVDLKLDAGPKFAILGAGLDAVLRGGMRVQSTPTSALIAKGAVETARGTYYAFGRELEIERGRLYFDGPIDDPAIDVRALRRHLPVQAGVEVTGTVRVPLVRLVSEPPVSDAEKISWLVLGRPLDSASTADFGLLQSAAGVLVDYGDSIPIQRRIARGVGLDDIALRGSGTLGTQVVAAGKRLSDKVYLEYEQGLTGAANIVRLNYALTRTLSLRAETGTSTGFGVTYGRAFD